MGDIKKIGLQNFRVFKEMQEFELAPITVLTGKNSSGKSSVIKALTLLSENAKKNNLLNLDFNLKEKKHNLVSLKNVLNNPNKELKFSFTFDATDIYSTDPNLRFMPEKTKTFKVTYIYKTVDKPEDVSNRNNIQGIKLTEILENNKEQIIIDYNTSLKQNINVNWFWEIIKKKQLVSPALTNNHNEYIEYKYNREFFDIFPNYLGEDFFMPKLKNLNKKHVMNFIKEFHTKLLLILISDRSTVINIISLFNLKENQNFSLEVFDEFIDECEYSTNKSTNKVKHIFFRSLGGEEEIQQLINNSKYKDILSVVGDVSILDIYDKYKLKIINDKLRLIIDMFIKNIATNIKFDFMEFNKTNFEHVYTNQTDNTVFAEILKTYFDYNVDKKLKKSIKENKEYYEKRLKDYEINKKVKKIIIDKLIKSGYIIKKISFYDYLDFNFGEIGIASIVPFDNIKLNKQNEIIFTKSDRINTTAKKLEDDFQKIALNELKNNGYRIKKEVSFNDFEFSKTGTEINSFFEIIIKEGTKEIFLFNEDKPKLKLTEIERELNYINYWLGKDGFDIGEKILIEKTDYATVIKILKNGREINIADLGTGANQVLALILKILSFKNKIRLMVEEPEVNLHPSFQSKLADLIVDAKKGIKTATFLNKREFIIETHSEYFIRRLQYLVAKKVIKPEDVAIYYFNDPKDLKEGEKQIVKLEIREDGMMDKDFGTGFFDESSKLTMDLLKIQNLS